MNRFIISIFTLTATLSALGWGQKGHDVTAAIAESHLTETTRSKIDSLLDGKSIIYYANWLDNASHTPEYLYSKTWHYKNVDADKTFENAPTLQSGNILTALDRETAILMNPKTSKAEASLALKMVVHLLGDLHQPMHLGHESDRGGNNWKVKFFNSDSNLHTVWDSRIPESGHKWSYTEWKEQIDRADSASGSIAEGSYSDWGKESYDICTEIYRKTPQGTKISYDYIAEWTPVIEQQFLKGGLRLADVLNSIFDPDYNGKNGSVKR